jgi:hypothetical protein
LDVKEGKEKGDLLKREKEVEEGWMEQLFLPICWASELEVATGEAEVKATA